MKDDGGKAFPRVQVVIGGSVESIGTLWQQGNEGMSLRDWFAGQALVGVLGIPGEDSVSDLAEYAYLLADAMLAAREREEADNGQ